MNSRVISVSSREIFSIRATHVSFVYGPSASCAKNLALLFSMFLLNNVLLVRRGRRYLGPWCAGVYGLCLSSRGKLVDGNGVSKGRKDRGKCLDGSVRVLP